MGQLTVVRASSSVAPSARSLSGSGTASGSARRKKALLVAVLAQEHVRFVDGDELAAIDDGDAIGELLGLFEVVRGEHDRRAFGAQLAHVGPQILAQRDVDAGGRLVEERDARAMHERLGDEQAPPHAARQLARGDVGLVRQRHRRQQLVDARLRRRHAEVAHLEAQHLARREEGIEVDLLRHQPDDAPRAIASATTSWP